LKGVTTRGTALVLLIVVSIVYQFPLVYDLVHKPFFNWSPGIDVASTTLLPLSLLEHGDLTLDQFQDFAKEYYRDPYFLATVNGRTVSRYPVIAAVLAMPLYGPPLATGWMANSGYPWLPYPLTAFMVARFAAGLMTALAVVMFFFCARELADLKTSAALALVFGLGTSVWSTASQGLWQHTPSLLLQLIGIWFILRGRRHGAMAVAPGALFFSAATIARQNDALPALLFTVYVWLEYRPAVWRWIAWALPPALLAMAYNVVYNGSPLVFGYQEGLQQTMGWPRLDGIAGLLLSPSRGLLVYSPFFAFVFVGLRQLAKDPYRRFYGFAALVFALGVLFLSTFQSWDGGWGYGTRLVIDVLPYAMFLLIPAFTRLGRVPSAIFWGTAVYGAVLQSFALWDGGGSWHLHWPNYAYDVWNLAENEPLFYLKEYVALAQHYVSRLMMK
jgi:hypothetical protein